MKIFTRPRDIPIPIISSNTNSFGSSTFNSFTSFLYALGAIVKEKKAINDAVSADLSANAINSIINDDQVPPPGNFPMPNKVAN